MTRTAASLMVFCAAYTVPALNGSVLAASIIMDPATLSFDLGNSTTTVTLVAGETNPPFTEGLLTFSVTTTVVGLDSIEVPTFWGFPATIISDGDPLDPFDDRSPQITSASSFFLTEFSFGLS